jgi:hypothetical protein
LLNTSPISGDAIVLLVHSTRPLRDGSILPLCSTRRVQVPLRVMEVGVLAVFVRQNGPVNDGDPGRQLLVGRWWAHSALAG